MNGIAEVGSVFVSVLPSMKGFTEKVNTALKGIGDVNINVNTSFDVGKLKAQAQAAASEAAASAKASIKLDADISALDSKIAKAQAELEAFKAKASGSSPKLDLDISQAEAKKAKLEAELDELRSKKASPSVDADITRAQAALDQVDAKLTALSAKRASVGVDADTAAADTELRALEVELQRLQSQRAKIGVDVDAGRATADMAAVDEAANRLDGRDLSMRVTADVASAIAGLASLATAAAALNERSINMKVGIDASTAIAGLALAAAKADALGGAAGGVAALGSAVLALGPAGVVAAGGLVSAVLGIGGVSKALTAMSGAQDTAGKDAQASGQKQAAAAQAVQSAQERLGQATQHAGEAREDAAKSVTRAEQSAAQSIQSAQDGVASAQKSLASATQAAAKTRRDAADSIASAEQSAARSIQSADATAAAAHKRFQQATTDLATAQKALTSSWEEGRRSLESLQNQVDDNTLDQRQAAFDLADAQKALNTARASGDADAISRAQLAYDKQVQSVKELTQKTQELGQDNTKAQAAGVTGTQAYTSALDQVKSAQASLADAATSATAADKAASQARVDGAASVAKAQQNAADSIAAADSRVVDAREALGKAEQSVNDARTKGAQAVADAQEQGARSIQSADQSVIDAQRALSQAMQKTGDDGAASMDKVKAAMANLSPAAAAFATYLFSLKPALDSLKASAATGFFPPLQAGIAAMMTQLPNLIAIVGQFGAAMGGALGYILGQLASPLWIGFFSTFAAVSGPIMMGLAQAFMHVAAAVFGLLEALLPFTPAALQVVGLIGDLIQAWTPFLAQMVGALIPVAGEVIKAFIPFGPVFAALGPILATLGHAFAVILIAVLQALAPILVALTPLIQQLALMIAAHLVGAIQSATPFLIGLANFMSAHPGLVWAVIVAMGTLVSVWKVFKALMSVFLTPLLLIRLAMHALGVTFEDLLGPINKAAKTFGGWIKTLVPDMSVMGTYRFAVEKIGQAFGFVARALLGALGPIGWAIVIFGILFSSNEQLRGAVFNLIGAFLSIAGAIIQSVMPVFTAISNVMSIFGNTIAGVVSWIASWLVPVFNGLAWVVNYLHPLIVVLVDAFLAYKVATLGWAAAQGLATLAMNGYKAAVVGVNAVLGVWKAIQAEGLAAFVATRVATVASTAATWLMTAAQWAWNAAMDANPIMIIVLIIAALVAAVIYAYNHFAWFRDLVNNVWSNIKLGAEQMWAGIVAAFNAVVGFFKQWGVVILAVLLPFIGLPILIYQHWGAIEAFFVGLWNSITSYFSTQFGLIAALFATVWGGIVSFFTGIWNGIWGVVMAVWNAIVGWLTAMFYVHYALWMQIWGAISGFFSAIWNGIRDVAMTVWNAIASFFAGALAIFVAFFVNLWNGLVWEFTTAWNIVRNVAITVWNAIVAFFTPALNWFAAFFTNLWNGLVWEFTTAWNIIRNIAITVWNAIVAFLTPAINAFAAVFAYIWNGISSFFSMIWNGIRNEAITLWNAISSFFSGAFNAFSSFFAGVWNGIAGTFSRIWQSISDEAGRIWNGIVGIIKGAVNGVIDAANWMTDKINVVLKFLLIPLIPGIPRLEAGGVIGLARGGKLGNDVEYAARGTKIGSGFVTNGPRVVVGEGRAAYPEYVVPTDPAYRGRALDLHASLTADLGLTNGVGAAGMGPMGGEGTPQLSIGGIIGGVGSWIGDRANDVGDFASSGWKKLTDAIGDAAQWVGDPLNALKAGTKGAMNSLMPTGLFHDASNWIVDKVFDAVSNKVQQAQAAMSGGDAAMGPLSASHALDIVNAAKSKGIPHAGAVIAIMTGLQESGLKIYANSNVPASMALPHEAVGHDHDSVGIFQQRQTWGPTPLLMNPFGSAQLFYNRLGRGPYGDYGAEAQRVQVSAFPGAYSKWRAQAEGLVAGAGFDQGGIANGTGFLAKQVITPERVLSPRQTSAFEKLAPMLASMQNSGQGSVYSPSEYTHNQGGRGVTQINNFNQPIDEQSVAASTLRRLDFQQRMQ